MVCGLAWPYFLWQESTRIRFYPKICNSNTCFLSDLHWHGLSKNCLRFAFKVNFQCQKSSETLWFLFSHNLFFWFFLHVSKSQYYLQIWIKIVPIDQIWAIFRNKLKKHSVAKNCSDLLLFEQIVVVISKILQILGLQPGI